MSRQIPSDLLYLHINIRMNLLIFFFKVYRDFSCDCIEYAHNLGRIDITYQVLQSMNMAYLFFVVPTFFLLEMFYSS